MTSTISQLAPEEEKTNIIEASDTAMLWSAPQSHSGLS
jgi:hypothetical protein